MSSRIMHQHGLDDRFRPMALVVCTAALPFYPVIVLIQRPLLLFSFLVPLLTVLVSHKGEVLWQVPPLVMLSVVMLPVGLIRRRHHLWRVLQVASVAVLMYAMVLVFELLLVMRDATNFSYFFGRAGFALIVVTVLANVHQLRLVRLSLLALTIAVSILGVLTILHGFGVYSTPWAMYRLAARTFFGIRFPVARTLGLAMSYGKFGILCSLALSTVLFSVFSPYKVIRHRWLQILFGFLVLAGVLICQSRGVFLAVAATLALGASMAISVRWEQRHPAQARLLRRCLFTGAVVLVVIMSVAVFTPSFAEMDVDLMDVGTSKGYHNVVSRIEVNRDALDLLIHHPLLGIGHGTISSLSDEQTTVHNHFLEQFAATGLVGGLVYLLFYVAVAMMAWRVSLRGRDAMRRTLASILLVGLVAAFLEYLVFPGFLVEAVALECGLVLFLYADHVSAWRFTD